MNFTIGDQKTGSCLRLHNGEKKFDRFYYTQDRDNKFFTIAWNKGERQEMRIDGQSYELQTNAIVPLMFNQSFDFNRPESIVAWQFNREFYCIVDHDVEVSCAGFLFGMGDQVFITPDERSLHKLTLLHTIFIEELNTSDNIQNEMVLVLLKRLIIFLTKLARSEYIPDTRLHDERLDLFRKFNLLVEADYHTEHSVNYYAQRLNKSPKTLANLFALYNHKTPLQVIQGRIVIEAKRLLTYTNKSTKEITHELGFTDSAYFCNFFKRHTSVTPLEFRSGKNLS